MNFGYYVSTDEAGEFHADVRDIEGNIRLQVTSNDDGEIWHVIDGNMQDRFDLEGLCTWAMDLELLPPNATIYPSCFFEDMRLARGNALALILGLNKAIDIDALRVNAKALESAVESVVEKRLQKAGALA